MRELLKKGGYLSIDEDVLRRALRLFSFRISMALADNNPAFIADAYEQAENLPSSSTEIRLSQSDIILNGELVSSHDSAVTLCFKKSTPYAMKCIDTTEQRKLISMHSQLKHANIVDFELVDKRFMIMTLYPTTLEHLKYVDDDTAMKLWQSMGGALAHLHSTYLAHMDVKPENIFISTCGSFVLGDLGSVATFGEKTKSTRTYTPHDMQGQNTNTQTARAEVDWWMLAMVFCEKAAGHNVGGGSRELRRGEIYEMLSQNQRLHQFWPPFAAKLSIS
jgi:hypothetical protein